MTHPEPVKGSETWCRWLDTADVDTRKANPGYYWGRRFAEAATEYYWGEQSVTSEEYAASMGDEVPIMAGDRYPL
jgi:hypothetical protein